MTTTLPPLHRILIVDDMPAVRQALRWAFEDTPNLIIVGEAKNGKDALTLVTRLHPDIVILDLEMPQLDGFAVAKIIKQLDPSPLIIFLTVHSSKAIRQRAIAVGGDAFVEKSAGLPALLTQIQYLINHHDK